MSECKCFGVMLEKVSENLRDQLPEKEAESFNARWGNEALVMEEKSITFKVGIPVSYEYQKLKKSGEPQKNRTKGDVKIMMSYCPFCGANLKEKVKGGNS